MDLPPSLQSELDNLLGLPKLSYSQKKRAQKLLAQQAELMSRGGSNEPAPTYTPPLEYPKKNTRASRADTLYRTYEDWHRANAGRVSTDIDYEWIARNNFALQEKFPKGVLETNTHYYKRLVQEIQKRKQNLDLLNRPVEYDPNPAKGHLVQGRFDPTKPTFIALDIESDDYRRPISVAAVRLQWNARTKRFESIDNYQRFYMAHNKDLVGTFETHGLTSAGLISLRKQQGLNYSTHYNSKEEAALREFIGSGIVLGHNIVDFDLPALFRNNPLTNSTIDTLKAARSAWRGRKNDLEHVIYRIFGKTMEEMGFPHHKAGADAVAEALVAMAMANDPGVVGQSIRYVMGAGDSRHIAEYNYMLHSMITKGTYRTMYRSNDLYEVFMDERETGLRDANGNYIEDPKLWGGSTFSDPIDIDERVAANVNIEEIQEISRRLKRLESAGDASLHGKYGKMTPTQINNAEDDLFTAFNKFNNYKAASIIKEIAAARNDEYISHIGKTYGYDTQGDDWGTLVSLGKTQRALKEKEQKTDLYRKIEKLLDERKITGHQYKELHNIKYLTGSYEDLAEATDKVIQKNEQLLDVFERIGDVRPYDVNQYISAAKGQWSGIMGASRGVVPSFIRNPVSRLGDAYFNVVDRSVAPWNAFNRAWNSGIGNLVTGTLGAMGGPTGTMIGLGISGAVSAGTQIYGNYQQSKMELAGLNIQNNLNTLGAMISWISTPFQLLHKALKLAIGSLGGFSLKLNSIMGSGINLMSQMGNPLEQMTGVDYLRYQGTTLMDLASLQSRGSTNSAIESFATMQRNLYRFGQVDTGKLLAANMLGVFNEAFSPTTDTVGAYYSMGNKILNNMKGQTASQQADTLYYVNQLNSSLAQTLRSAILMGVSDLHQLTDPSAFHQMYWRPISDVEEGRFRKTQYEYGVATQQFGYSKMRFADRLWNSIGRDIYNGLNELVDKAAGGDWKGVLESAGDMWAELKTKFSEVWNGKDGEGGIGEKITGGLNTAWESIKKWAIRIANGIIDVWDQIFLAVLNKAQGVIAYLSTVQVDFVRDKKTGKWGINISTIGSVEAQAENKYIYNAESGKAQKGMEGYAALVEALYPDQKLSERNITKEQLRERLLHLPGIIKDGVLDTPEINLPEYGIQGLNLGHNPELVDPLLEYLEKATSGGTGFRKQAAAWIAPAELRSYMDSSVYHLPITDMAERLINREQEIRYEISNHVSEAVDKDAKVTFDFKLGDKNATVTYQQSKGINVTGIPLLQQVGLGNGMSVAVSKTR